MQNEMAMMQVGGVIGGGMMVRPDPAAVAAAEQQRARIQSAYQMAVFRPRKADDVRVRVLQSCKHPVLADQAEFAKPVGDKVITGASIRLMETIARLSGNILIDKATIYEDERIRRLSVLVIELESNCQYTSEITVTKTVERRSARDREVLGERVNKHGEKVFVVAATEDELLTKENAQVSKAIRVLLGRVLPAELIEEALDTCRQVAKDKDAKDPAAARKALCDAFAGIGIMPADLEAYIGHPLTAVTPQELGDLRKKWKAIQDGEAKWSDFAQSGASVPAEEREAKAAAGANKAAKIADARKAKAATAPAKTGDSTGGAAPAAAPAAKAQGEPENAPDQELQELRNVGPDGLHMVPMANVAKILNVPAHLVEAYLKSFGEACGGMAYGKVARDIEMYPEVWAERLKNWVDTIDAQQG